MRLICILIYCIPVIIVHTLDFQLGIAMNLFSLIAIPIIEVVTDTPGGKLTLFGVFIAFYYWVAINAIMN